MKSNITKMITLCLCMVVVGFAAQKGQEPIKIEPNTVIQGNSYYDNLLNQMTNHNADEPKVVAEKQNPDQEKLNDYIAQGLGRVENNIIIDSEGTGLRDGSITLTGADSYGDGWNGNTLTVNGASYAVEGSSGSWDLGVLASGDYAVSCGGGSWGSEVSWAFSDAAGNTILSGSVGDYTLTVGDSGCADGDAHSLSVGGGSWGSEVGWSIAGTSYSGSVGDFSLCLADGDYTFDMTDAYGDGWNGNTATITDSDGGVVASGGLDAGASGSFDFNLGGPPPIGGCTDPGAPNYNADAEVDDGSCEFYCTDTQFACASGDQCVPAGYACDGSSEFGNAGWGADCADGSDEGEACCGGPDGGDYSVTIRISHAHSKIITCTGATITTTYTAVI